jgi:PST family polysaccharide transporter
MSLKKQFISSTVIVAVTKYSGFLIGLIIMAILSRLLTPDDFGQIAIISVLAAFFNLLGEMGIGPAIIQKKELTQNDINIIFSLTILIGVLLAVTFFCLSPIVSSFYQQPTLDKICRLFSINVLCACLNIVPNALILKDKNFKFLMYRQFIIQPISGGLGIAAAFNNWGVYALLVHSISTGVLTFLVNYLHCSLKIVRIKMLSILKIANYSAYQFLFDFINYFARNLDSLLIGKYMSPSALGNYEKSYRLMLLPIGILTRVLSPAIQPYFSDFQYDKRRIFLSYIKIVHLLALIGLPLSVFLHFSANELILIVFGEQWTTAIPVLEILAWSSGIQVILSSTGSIFQAANDTKRLFIVGFINAASLIAAICIGIFIFQSLTIVAYSLLVAFVFSFGISFCILIKITLGQSLIQFALQLKQPLIIGLLVCTLEWAVKQWACAYNLYISLTIKAFIAGMLMFPAIYNYLKKNNK